MNELAAMNSMDDKMVSNRTATEKKLMDLAEKMNIYRQTGFDNLIDFHFSVKEYTTIEEWNKIMKFFYKELRITSH